jgi:hypothetical protein
MNSVDNLARWSSEDSFMPSWNIRTHMMSTMIPDGTKTLLEFGAGLRYLESIIPETIEYTPTDIISRGEGTIVKDINCDPSDYGKYDVSFFSGVFEYVTDLPGFISYLPSISPTVVCSYSSLAADAKNMEIHGWANNYTQRKFRHLFKLAGYVTLQHKTWKTQELYTFSLPNIG